MRFGISALLSLTACTASSADPRQESPPPHIVLILADNLGYGDLGCYGSARHRTPHIDRLAAEGTRFTHAYAASGVCTPSRAALLTGCYPVRIGMHESERREPVFFPDTARGLHPDERTLAELLKSAGYRTACVGKWHVGHRPAFLPTGQGFDSFFGIPYSEDMQENPKRSWPPLPLLRQEKTVDAPTDPGRLLRRFTEEAASLIRSHREGPLFLYFAPAAPGSCNPPVCGEAFRGKSGNGTWGDAVEELDWATGEILAALRDAGMEQNTLVLWTNDNGAPLRKPPQGSNSPLGGWGYTVAEGGMRVPLLARLPGRIPAGRASAEFVTLMDLWPTLARLARAPAQPTRGPIDGKDIGPILWDVPGARSPHDAFFYYEKGRLRAVRSGSSKLYVEGPRLYDVVEDPGETRDLAARRPDAVASLAALAERAREDLGDGDRPGRHRRTAGFD